MWGRGGEEKEIRWSRGKSQKKGGGTKSFEKVKGKGERKKTMTKAKVRISHKTGKVGKKGKRALRHLRWDFCSEVYQRKKKRGFLEVQ